MFDEAIKDVSAEEETESPKSAETGDSETSKESSTEKTENRNTSEEDDKTASEEIDVEKDSDGIETEEKIVEGKPIPYDRFKKVNESYKSLKSEMEEVDELFSHPEVYKAVLIARGITDKDIISQKMKEVGFEQENKDNDSVDEDISDEIIEQLAKGLDLTKAKDYIKLQSRISRYEAKRTAEKEIGFVKNDIISRKVSEEISKMESEASRIAKEDYGIEYGTSGKDENNINTAVGKMDFYLKKHPEDAKLGHVKVLRLALAEESIKLGEKKGVIKEKERLKSLKSSAFEGNDNFSEDKEPDGLTASTREILDWSRKHNR